MMYPVNATTYIQTDNILFMTTTLVTMNDAAVTTFVVSATVGADIIRCVNENHA